eukprot:3689837-Prymnesium_polylepis.1
MRKDESVGGGAKGSGSALVGTDARLLGLHDDSFQRAVHLRLRPRAVEALDEELDVLPALMRKSTR